MKKAFGLLMALFFTSQSYAWGFASGKVDVFYVNTFGNYASEYLNGGYCFKLAGFDYYLKVQYSDVGEKKNNMQLVQSMVLTAHLSGRQLKATYVDWGTDPTCRVEGATLPAKWLENLQLLN